MDRKEPTAWSTVKYSSARSRAAEPSRCRVTSSRSSPTQARAIASGSRGATTIPAPPPVRFPALGRAAEQPQPYGGEFGVDPGERSDQRLEVLDRVDPPGPADRRSRRFAPGRREVARVDAVVDGLDAVRARSAAHLP